LVEVTFSAAALTNDGMGLLSGSFGQCGTLAKKAIATAVAAMVRRTSRRPFT
jgi:hypothetical protein